MGFGDALMVSAQARELHASTGRKVAVGDGHRLRMGPPEIEVFRHNPHIAAQADLDRGTPVAWLVNYSGHRPYVDRARMETEFANLFPGRQFTMKVRDPKLPWRFTDWSVKSAGPGELRLTTMERARARSVTEGLGPFAVIEAGVKNGASPNKAWPWERYIEAARALAMPIVQFNPARRLPDAIAIRTATFRDACAVLGQAEIYIGTEGGLHHAAAALGVPAVVYHGGYISPTTTGYEGQRALYRGVGSPCGMRVSCGHCAAIAMEITADEAVNAIKETLHDRRP